MGSVVTMVWYEKKLAGVYNKIKVNFEHDLKP